MTSIEQMFGERKARIDPDLRNAILVDRILAEFFTATAGQRDYWNDSSLPVFQDAAPFSRRNELGVPVERVESLSQTYRTLYKQLSSTWIGATTLVLGGENTLSPSSYSRTALEYIGRLQTENENLELRVSELEAKLKEVQIYWPTVKRLVTEYKSATVRVESIVRELTTQHGSRTGLEVAKERDVLESPAQSLFDELE